MKIKLVDNAFNGQPYTNPTWGGYSPIEWDRSAPTEDDPIVIYTDDSITAPKIGKVKIAWLFESEEFKPHNYEYIRNNIDEFDYVFTWTKSLIEFNPKCRMLPYGGSWINDHEISFYEKSKDVSIVASAKNFMSGHALRHEAIKRFPGKFDVYGNGYNRVDSLLTAFKDYRFTIVIENSKVAYGFSEKLVTPILCGTIPVYYGSPNIGSFFDPRGMFQFNTLDELEVILSSLNAEKYNQMKEYARQNMVRAEEYKLMEYTVYKELIKLGLLNEICSN